MSNNSLTIPASLTVALLAISGLARAEESLSFSMVTRDITPDWKAKKVWMAGYGQNRDARGVMDPIELRAIVLSDGTRKIAIVSIDVIGLFHETTEEIRSKLEGFDHVMIHTTHNHEGPDTMGMWGPSEFKSGIDPEYVERIKREAVEAVNEAAGKLQPAQAVIGQAQGDYMIYDDRIPVVEEGRLRVLGFKSPEGKLLGAVVFWTNHPESLGPRNYQLSKDYLGSMLSKLRKDLDCPVTFFNGPVGGMMSPGNILKAADGRELNDHNIPDFTIEVGLQAANLAEQGLAGAKPIRLTPFKVKSKAFLLEVANPKFTMAVLAGLMKRKVHKAGEEEVKAGIPAGTNCIRTEVSRLFLGDLELICVPGEMYPELVIGGIQHPTLPEADFPDAAPEKAILMDPSPRTQIVIGLASDEIGYIIPKCQWDEKAPFCYGRKDDQYGEENSAGPDTAPRILACLEELAEPARSAMAKRTSGEFLNALAKDRDAYAASRKQLTPPVETMRICTHFHSLVSHDSRTTYEEVSEVAKKFDVKAVFFTDHPVGEGKEWTMMKRDVLNGLLIVPGTENGSKDGCRLIMAAPKGDTSRETGYFAGHTEEASVASILADNCDGMEIYNIHSDCLDRDKDILLSMKDKPLSLLQILGAWRNNPNEFLKVIVDYPYHHILVWDAINRTRESVFPGITANDAHKNVGIKLEADDKGGVRVSDVIEGEEIANIKKGTVATMMKGSFGLDKGPFLAQLDPLEITVPHTLNHVWGAECTEESLLKALKAGQSYVGFDWLCATEGFGFWAEDKSGRKATFGQSIELSEGMRLKAQLPVAAYIRVFRDGYIYWADHADALDMALARPGKYRLEAFLTAGGDMYPWVLSNPVAVLSHKAPARND
ncbi:MAG TPA: hypothetical protein PL033_01550 [Candidatus Brocadiia bacterium]|nr:hypothetical protein [Candidatus Brocadiia bacterium]